MECPLWHFPVQRIREKEEEAMAMILVLDDEPDACSLVERLFTNQHQVYSFTDEEDAIAFAGRHSVDLAILDIKLKRMSGVDVLRKLREIRPEIRALMLTGYPTVETARQSITLGAHEYLLKPIDIDELEEKVKKVLSAKKKTAKAVLKIDE
jgi:DNA-binding NtrC family response regulator